MTKAVASGAKDVPAPGVLAGEFAELKTGLDEIARAAKYDRGLFQGILGGLPMPYLFVDTQERAVRINQACLDMLEIDGPVEKCHGKTLAEIFYNDPTRKTAVGQSIRDGKVFRNLDVTIKGHKGGERHVLANVFPLEDLDRRCAGGLCLYVDMTALKQAEGLIKDNLDRFSSVAKSLEGVVEVATSASNDLTARIERSNLGAKEQSQRVAETATAMEEMNATVLEVAKNASLASQVSDEACQKAKEGLRVVDLAVAGIENVRDQALELRQDMGVLGNQAEGIGRIMGVISDIADQTNLLALNAAIEAARAGDAGRGFAVVADEVRKLAEKTMTATKEVGEAIQGIQSGTRKSMDGVDRSSTAIEKATAHVKDSGDSLKVIAKLVEDASDQVRAIATAAEEQSSASEEINNSIVQVAAISSETLQSMEEATTAVGELAEQTQVLRGLITRMRS